MPKTNRESIERLVIKVPKSVAEYFRATFAHGKRSDFFAEKILEHKHSQEVKATEDKLRVLSAKRQ